MKVKVRVVGARLGFVGLNRAEAGWGRFWAGLVGRNGLWIWG